MPIVVYASNILEYVSKVNEDQKKEFPFNIVKNIRSINPQSTIHFFTSDKVFNKYAGLRPDTRVIVEGAEIMQPIQSIPKHLQTRMSENMDGKSKLEALSTTESTKALPIVSQFEKEKEAKNKSHQQAKQRTQSFLGLHKGFLKPKPSVEKVSGNLNPDAFNTTELAKALPIVNQFENEKSKPSGDKKQQPPKAKKENGFGFKPGFLNKA